MSSASRTRERRAAPRRLVGMDAKIVTAGGQVFKCRILDVSADGALLLVPSVLGIPDRFKILDPYGRAHGVQTARRAASRLGVKFNDRGRND